MAETPDFRVLEKRLKNLERRNSLLVLLLFLIVIGIGLFVYFQKGKGFMAKAMSAGNTVYGEKFLLRDKAGKIHAALELSEAGQPMFNLMDENGSPRLKFSLEKEGEPQITLLSTDNLPKARFALPNGLAELSFLNDAGNPIFKQEVLEGAKGSQIVLYDGDQIGRVFLGSNNKEEEPYFSMAGKDKSYRSLLTLKDDRPIFAFSSNGKTNRLLLALRDSGDSSLELLDAAGVTRIMADVEEEGAPGLSFKNKEKVERLWLTLDKKEEPYVAVFDKSGTNRILMGMKSDNKPFLALRNEEGKTSTLISDQRRKKEEKEAAVPE